VTRSIPDAAILINNYNYARYLPDAVDSALAQEGVDVEVIVVDDGSTDGSLDVLGRYGDRITVVAKANGGQASSFNIGFEHANAPVILLLDADDRFLPGKAGVVCDALSDPDVGWCFHPLAYVDADGAPTDVADGPPPLAGGRVDVRAAMRRGRPPSFLAPATTGLAFRSTLLARILPMPVEIRITADNYLKAAALGLSAGVVHAEPLAEQRLHGDNAYTGLSVMSPIKVATELDIATKLHDNWPELRPYALARGLGALRTSRQVEDPVVTEAARRFRSVGGARSRLRIRAHELWWTLRRG
jgi:hypothetical protein